MYKMNEQKKNVRPFIHKKKNYNNNLSAINLSVTRFRENFTLFVQVARKTI